MMNKSKVYFTSLEFCGDSLGFHLLDEIKKEILVSSIFVDLISGLFSSMFTYQMYFGVDITHPVYSVVFSNIILSILLSYSAFVGKLIAACVQSCVPLVLNMITQSCLFFMNSICWVVVAFLRYRLLVTMKRQDYEEDRMDMERLKKLALFAYWGSIIVFSLIRCTFVLGNYFGLISKVSRGAYFAILSVVFPTCTCTVYYKLDLELERRKHDVNNENRVQALNPETRDTKRSSTANAHNSTGRSCSDKKAMLTKKNKMDIRLWNTSKVTPQINQSSIVSFQPKSRNADSTVNLNSPDDLPYGGIYIGVSKKGSLDVNINAMTALEENDYMHKAIDVKNEKRQKLNVCKFHGKITTLGIPTSLTIQFISTKMYH